MFWPNVTQGQLWTGVTWSSPGSGAECGLSSSGSWPWGLLVHRSWGQLGAPRVKLLGL